jgi:amino acid transporter
LAELRAKATQALVEMLAYSGTLLAIGPAAFKANFNAQSGMNYDAVISAAKAAGWPGMSLAATLLGVEFTFINFLGFTSSAYISGEIKEVRKSQLLAIVGAVIVFGLITWFAYEVAYYTMGGEFIGSISQLAATGDPSYKLPDMPFFMYLFQYATQSPLVYAIFLFGWSMMPLAAGLTYMFTGVRLIFAWSFDRVLPTALSKVDSKYNSPYVALIAATILAILFQVAWIYTKLSNFFAYIVFGWMVMQILAAISGILFPYRRKDIFESAPPIVKKKLAGVPVLSMLGFLTIVISFWLGYASLGPSFVGQLDWTVFGFTILLFVAGLVIYAISSAYHKSKGIPLELTFKEIPPE